MNCVSMLSTSNDPEAAIAEILERLGAAFGGEPADLVTGFATPRHADTLGDLALRLRGAGLCRTFLGTTGESVVAEGREIEEGPALAVWAIRLPGATLKPLRITFDGNAFEGWAPPDAGGAPPTLLLLADPFSFPADRFLAHAEGAAKGMTVAGGMASGSQRPGGNRLVIDDDVYDDGAVALEVSGPFAVRTVVSQGCRPVGRTMIVTRVERNVIRELGRRKAYDVLRETFEGLDESDKALVQNGLHLGRVINEYQETFRRGDFLVKNVLGVDEEGGLAVSDLIRVGQTVQFHVRDAGTADEDLKGLLEGPNDGVRGALLFSCNGRGTRMFPAPNHDVGVIHEKVGPVPVAGFFAMGEIGPIGGQNFVHGFTASVVLFEEHGAGTPGAPGNVG